MIACAAPGYVNLLRLASKALVRRALQAYAAAPATGFSDCMIAQLNAEAGCETTLTFDKRAAKGAGFDLLA